MLIKRFTSGIGLFYLETVIYLIILKILSLTVGALLTNILGAIYKIFCCILCCCCMKSQAQNDKEKKALAIA